MYEFMTRWCRNGRVQHRLVAMLPGLQYSRIRHARGSGRRPPEGQKRQRGDIVAVRKADTVGIQLAVGGTPYGLSRMCITACSPVRLSPWLPAASALTPYPSTLQLQLAVQRPAHTQVECGTQRLRGKQHGKAGSPTLSPPLPTPTTVGLAFAYLKYFLCLVAPEHLFTLPPFPHVALPTWRSSNFSQVPSALTSRLLTVVCTLAPVALATRSMSPVSTRPAQKMPRSAKYWAWGQTWG